MSQPLSCFIESIKDLHAELRSALEHLILSAVAVMTTYSSDAYCDFRLHCQDLPQNLVEGVPPTTIRITWHSETAAASEIISTIHQPKNLVEYAAIAVAFLLFPKVVNLSGFEVADAGERADYWIDGRRYMIEISGTENQNRDRVSQRQREKIEQLLSNPSKQNGFVVVCSFATREILLSFHEQERQND